MNKLVIILADTDDKYLIPLELKFIEEFEDSAEIIVITDKNYLEKYFSTPKKVDILVINENLYTNELEKHSIINTFILSESYVEDNTGNINISNIYKYTSVKEIFNEIISESNYKNLNVMNKENNTKVFMVYSPCGGIGKTLVSLGICAALAKGYKRALYINMESLQSFNYILKNKNYSSNGFERQIINHSENILEYFHDSIGSELFDFILPFKQSTSAYNIKIEDYKYLIEAIKNSGLYDFIIVDTSSEFTSEKTFMMGYCNKVIIVTGQDEVSVSKLDCMFNNMDCSDDKFIFVCNKYIREKSNNLVSKCLISEYITNFEFTISNFNIEFLGNNEHFQRLVYMFI